MNKDAAAPSVWSRLDGLSDSDLRLLVDSAVRVIGDEVGEGAGLDAARLPPGPLAKQLLAELTANGVPADAAVAEKVARDTQISRPLALITLRELAANPVLADRIESAYEARRGMMLVEGGVLLGAALVLLVLKLKKVHVGKDGADVDFYEAKEGWLGKVSGLLGL